MTKKPIGGDFEDFLRDEHLLDDAEVLAHRIGMSRPALDRLLDPTNLSVTLSTLERAASAVGKRLKVEPSGWTLRVGCWVVSYR